MHTQLKKYFLVFLVLTGILSADNSYKHELSICTIFQNEADYLREWIEFHKLVGVQHFYLYNNLSNDNYKEVLQPYIDAGEVDLIDWDKASTNLSNWNTIQCNAYSHAIKSTADQTKWLAILDTDEFLFPVEVDQLTEFLKDYENYGGLCVNWQLYGTSKVSEILYGDLLIEKLTFKAPTKYVLNEIIKSIVRPDRVQKVENNPHYFIYKKGYYAVNSLKKPVHTLKNTININKVRINHYWVRDEKYLHDIKIPRRLKWGESESYVLRSVEKTNIVEDTTIFKYIPRLKKAMNIN